MEHLVEIIRIELLDELTHPRVRKTTIEKLQIAYERIENSSLSDNLKMELKKLYMTVYKNVNTF